MINPASIPLTGDERAILQILVDTPDPLDSFTIFCAIAPQPTAGDGRSRESRLWRERKSELFEALAALYKAGFAFDAVPADGWNADQYAITDAGRAALAATTEMEG